MAAAGDTHAEPALASSSPLETRAELSVDSLAPALMVDGSRVRADAAPVNPVAPAISLSEDATRSDRSEAAIQASPERFAKDAPPAPEPLTATLPALEPPASEGGPDSPSAAAESINPPQSSAQRAAESRNGGFWQQVKDNPTQAMGTLYRLLEVGHATSDLALVERAYCGLALVYALRGDGPHASERLQHAHKAAMKRGNTEEVEKAVEIIDQILTAANLRR